MAIDLSGLDIPDVLVIVQAGDIIVRSSKQDVLDDVKELPCPIKVMKNGPNTQIIDCTAINCILLAERLATTWELKGYKVQRIYTPSDAYSRKPVESFILI